MCVFPQGAPTGALFTSLKMDLRQLLYLQTLLQRTDENWAKALLTLQNETNIAWAKQINKKLSDYNLEHSWEKITMMRKIEWKGKRSF